MGRGSGRRPLFQYAQFRPCMVELTSQLGSQTGSRGLNGTWQWAFVCCFRTAILAAVLEAAVDSPARPVAAVVSDPTRLAVVLKAAVDAPARPDGAAVPDPAAYGVYPFIILIVYVIVRLLFQQHQFTHPPNPSTPAVSQLSHVW